jgi:uncharacterized membrane protein
VRATAFFDATFAIAATLHRERDAESNHDFVKQLNALTSRFISVMLVLLAFVVLLPMSTRGLGESLGSDQVTTVVYAINVAIISSTEWICYRIAVGQRLFQVLPSPTEIRTSTVLQLLAPGVFLGSIALTLLWDPTAGRVSWLALVVIMPIAGSWARRTNAAAPVSAERRRPG